MQQVVEDLFKTLSSVNHCSCWGDHHSQEAATLMRDSVLKFVSADIVYAKVGEVVG